MTLRLPLPLEVDLHDRTQTATVNLSDSSSSLDRRPRAEHGRRAGPTPHSRRSRMGNSSHPRRHRERLEELDRLGT